jgi:glycosyltransferase involved in cell wall biosynthesis
VDVVLYVLNDVRHDSRVLREAGTLAAAGHHVTVMGTTRDADEAPGREVRDGFEIVRIPVPRRTPIFVTWVHRPWRLHRRLARDLRATFRGGPRAWVRALTSVGVAVLTLPWVVVRGAWELVLRARHVPPRPTWVDYVGVWRGRRFGWCRAAATAAPRGDVHHANDAETLPAALSAADRDRGRVVYDSHEIFTAWGPLLDQPAVVRAAFRRWERRLARRASALVTINDEIAGELRRLLAPRQTVVVHNCPPRWTPPEPAPDLLRRAVGIPSGAPVVLCHGNLQAGRGLEETAEAMTRPGLESAHLVFLGYGRKVVAAILDDPRFQGRIHVLDAVPPAELLPWVASADVDVMAIIPTDRNSVLSSPNKLFESIAAGVPVVTSDLPVRRRIILGDPGGPLGAVCDPTDPDSIAAAIRSILDPAPADRAALRTRILAAAHERWNWERESAGLVALYAGLAAGQA